MKKYNSPQIGAITGLILPIITVIFFYLFKYHHYTVKDFIDQLISYNIYGQIISLCVLPNLLLFFIYIWTDRLLSARGVIIATMFYTFIVLLLK